MKIDSKAQRCTKSIKVMVMLIFFSVFLMVTISSFAFDDFKDYDENLKTYSLDNFFGFGKHIADLELKTPQDFKVPRGYGKVAEIQIDNGEFDYNKIINGIELYNIREDMKELIRDVDYKYKTIIQVPRYETVCDESFSGNGTIINSNCRQEQAGLKNKIEWLDFTKNSLLKGENITLGIFTEVKKGDKVEWILNVYGNERLTAWAVWTESLDVGLISYYALNQTSGAVIDSRGSNDGTNDGATRGVEGIINNSFDFDGVDDSVNFGNDTSINNIFDNGGSISVWINATNPGSGRIFDKSNSDAFTEGFAFFPSTSTSGVYGLNFGKGFSGTRGVWSSTTKNINDDTWTHVVLTYDASSTTNDPILYVNGSSVAITESSTPVGTTASDAGFNLLMGRLSTAATDFFPGRIDEVGIWNRTLNASEVLNLFNNGNGLNFFIRGPTITLNSPVDNFNSTNQTIDFNGTVVSSVGIINVTLFIDGIVNETNSSGINNTDYLFTKIIADGNHNWTYESCSSDGCLNATTRTFSIDSIKPIINITSPVGQINSHAIGGPLFLNWTVTDLNLDSCFYEYNNINTTVTCNDNTTTFNTVLGQQNITFHANDTFGNENSAFTSWTYAFLETGVSFNEKVLETTSQFLEINISTDVVILSIEATLSYNDTNFTSVAFCTSGNCTITNTIDIPLVTSGESENKSFFWTLSIFNGTDSTSIQTTVREQNVTRIHLEECDGTFTVQTLNFIAQDEQNLSSIDPFLFAATFDQWLGNGSVKRQSNFSQLSISNEALCIFPTNETFFIDAIIEYDEAGNASLYTLRNYYFQNDTINNVSQDISLYLLLSSSSTSFILKVQDDSLLPVSGVLIETNRFYPGTDEFRIVQIARTDDLGKSVGFFETEIVDYKFFITLNNQTLLETGLQKVIPEVSPFTLTFNIGEPLGEPWKTQNEISNLISSLTWNDTSGFVTYIYIDSSGNLTLARLLVIQESLVNSTADSIICNETSSLTAATILCNVGNNSGFYVASSFINRGNGEGLDRQFTFQIETLSSVVGLLGLFYAWFLILIASFMFKFNEIAGIWAVTVTVLLINLTGLIKFGSVFVTGIIAVALILTWLMER